MAKPDAFNLNNNLTRGDFAMESANQISKVMWVSIRHSKTNQFNEYVHYVPLIPIPGSHMCPVEAVTKALSLARHKKPKDPAFCYPSLPRSSKFKILAGKIGLNPDKVSGHSFRRGGATFAFGLTNNHSLIKYVGDWLSDCYLIYNEMDSEQMKLLPTLMAAKMKQVSESL